jgi:4-alpha-glucanotransferase
LSSFAGNELLISLECLIEDGILSAKDCDPFSFSTTTVEYEAVLPFKRRSLERVWKNFRDGARKDLRHHFEKFCDDQKSWLDDYALFRTLKAKYQGAHYLNWAPELTRRKPAALLQARRETDDLFQVVRFAQFLLFRQAERLKEYAHSKGVRLIGDLPFFVAPDSSDVWAHPELFLLDDELRPRVVAGVPPDYFSAEGQLWGNPVYNWESLRASGYRWCIERLRALLAHVDVIRLDHFRAFVAAWHIPAGAPTAKSGNWEPGPGADFLLAVEKELGGFPFIAEDLGWITPDVLALRDRFQLPGMKVLQFAFDGDPKNPHLPQHYPVNCVVYTGTHDNNTTRGWFEALSKNEQQRVWSYLEEDGTSEGVAWDLMRVAWLSRAALAIAPVQDLLNLGAEARMNLPGRAGGNWRWRCPEELLSVAPLARLRDLTERSARSAAPGVLDPSAAGR